LSDCSCRFVDQQRRCCRKLRDRAVVVVMHTRVFLMFTCTSLGHVTIFASGCSGLTEIAMITEIRGAA
jgi:hypothetical protein